MEEKHKIEDKKEIPSENSQKKETEKKEEIKKQPEVKKKRSFVVTNGLNLRISTKEAGHVCNMIRNRNIDKAISMVEEVLNFRRVVKMNNREVPHQHGKGVMAGRYPKNTCEEFLKLLKQLKAEAIHHEIELEKAVIKEAIANVASKPYKRGGARMKRTHLKLKLAKKEEKK